MESVWLIFWIVTAVKLLLFPAYFSTDFDVHRNWLAITHSLPLEQWYTDATSQWTLDYPPFFAWFEWLLSQAAALVDPGMLVVTKEVYRSWGAVVFQRLSVVLTDLVLFFAIRAYASAQWPGLDDFAGEVLEGNSLAREAGPGASAALRSLRDLSVVGFIPKEQGFAPKEQRPEPPRSGKGTHADPEPRASHHALLGAALDERRRRTRRIREFFLVLVGFGNIGLLLLDHLHFQYNGFLLGLFVYSIAFIKQGRDLRAGLTFAVLLNFKHIFLYVAPVYFVYLLGHYCWTPEDPAWIGWEEFEKAHRNVKRKFNPRNFLKIACGTISIFLVSLGPWIWMGQLAQLKGRLFPFQRGLCHAYWAPNLWALYSGLDVAAGKLAPARRMLAAQGAGSQDLGIANGLGSALTSGLVGAEAGALPAVPAVVTFALTLLFMAPALIRVAKQPHPVVFNSALVYCSFCSFMLGFHVHEKAILLTLFPMALASFDSLRHGAVFILLSCFGHFSLMPLVFPATEQPLVVMLWLAGTLVVLATLKLRFLHLEAVKRISARSLLLPGETVLLLGLVPVFLLSWCLIPVFLPRMEFLPLMLISLYCAVGMMYCWMRTYLLMERNAAIIRSYSEEEEEEPAEQATGRFRQVLDSDSAGAAVADDD